MLFVKLAFFYSNLKIYESKHSYFFVFYLFCKLCGFVVFFLDVSICTYLQINVLFIFYFLAVNHVWVAGRLNMTKDINNDIVSYSWSNPSNGKRVPDPKTFGDTTSGLYVSAWLPAYLLRVKSCSTSKCISRKNAHVRSYQHSRPEVPAR